MNRKFIALVLVALAVAGTGCEKRSSSVTAPLAMMTAMSASAASQRFIAERHIFEIVTPESELQKSWESVIAFCGTIECEVVSSSIAMRTGDSLPSGDISLRVAPGDLTKLEDHIQKLGKIAQHTTEREDKTTAVVDTEARIKNLTSFRDSLRAMLAKPSATVKDLVEIQKQLTDTQSDLDSETAERKILANQTEKIAVAISFHVERPSSNLRGFSQIWSTLRESGDVLADSTASLITTIIAVIPWLVLIVPAVWLVAKGWRKLKLRRNQTPSSPASPTTTLDST